MHWYAYMGRTVAYRVTNSVEVLGACGQVLHESVVEDTCRQAQCLISLNHTTSHCSSWAGWKSLTPDNRHGMQQTLEA